MRKSLVFGVLIAIAAAGSIVALYAIRHTNPVIVCTSLDDSIRPKHYCLMNPFRDRRSEQIAEGILRELKNGNSDSIKSLLQHRTDDEITNIIGNEDKYRIHTWRIGGISKTDNELSLRYWVERANYYEKGHIEEVSFFFTEEGTNLKLKSFSAIY